MNKLFIIGNGFDLAHGLKTKYSDFVLWYLKKIIDKVKKDRLYSSHGFSLRHNYTIHPIDIDSYDDFRKLIQNQTLQIPGTTFISEMISKFLEANWIDIETYFYNKLVDIYKIVERYDGKKLKEGEDLARNLNESLEELKLGLVEYLSSLEIANDLKNDAIQKKLEWEFSNGFSSKDNQALFLVFNYTKTLHLYDSALKGKNIKIINIHGQIGCLEAPIVFGYGDETDYYYEKMERLNSNEFLKNIKSFNYCQTTMYRELIRFINLKQRYQTIIMGHSCGLSDRVLLRSILGHENCDEIKIYYHKKSEKENDFYFKTQEISRHFRPDQKDSMRIKILPFCDCMPLN